MRKERPPDTGRKPHGEPPLHETAGFTAETKKSIA
jgi:hypothetical protein